MIRTLGNILGVILIWAAISQAQWSTLMRISFARGGYNSSISTQGDTLHVVFEGLTSFNKTFIWYTKSIDAGSHWTSPLMISDTTGTNSVAFPTVISFRNSILIFWRHNFRDSLLRDDIGYCISTDGGQTWSVPQYLLNPNVDYLGYYDVCSNDSVVNVVYAHQSGSYPFHFKTVRSTNFGRTWGSPQEIFQSEDFGLLDMVSFGDRINVVWTGNFDYIRSREIYHFRSTDAGITWSGNDTLSMPDVYHSQFPKISSDENGNLYIIWMDFEDSPYQITGDLFGRTSTDGGVSWTPERQITYTHYATEPELCSHHDSIFVAWVDWRFGMAYLNIYSIHSTDNGTTWSSEERMEPELYFCTDPALAFSNGHAYLVFKDMRCMPDTDICGGAFFTKYPADPDRIIDNNSDLLPDEISLFAHPNPFNSSVTISYSNPNKGGDIAIYNIQGQLIKTFRMEGKEGKIIWDARDALGNKVSSGIYFLKAGASQKTYTIKLLYLR